MKRVTIDALITALQLPPGTRINRRVPKKMLQDFTPAITDKHTINAGIEDVFLLATLKPENCELAPYHDESREYREIGVLKLTVRAAAEMRPLVDLVHAAMPYPVLLLTKHTQRIGISLAHRQRTGNDRSSTTIDGSVVAVEYDATAHSTYLPDFRRALGVNERSARNLHTLYQRWIDELLTLPRK